MEGSRRLGGSCISGIEWLPEKVHALHGKWMSLLSSARAVYIEGVPLAYAFLSQPPIHKYLNSKQGGVARGRRETASGVGLLDYGVYAYGCSGNVPDDQSIFPPADCRSNSRSKSLVRGDAATCRRAIEGVL